MDVEKSFTSYSSWYLNLKCALTIKPKCWSLRASQFGTSTHQSLSNQIVVLFLNCTYPSRTGSYWWHRRRSHPKISRSCKHRCLVQMQCLHQTATRKRGRVGLQSAAQTCKLGGINVFVNGHNMCTILCLLLHSWSWKGFCLKKLQLFWY